MSLNHNSIDTFVLSDTRLLASDTSELPVNEAAVALVPASGPAEPSVTFE